MSETEPSTNPATLAAHLASFTENEPECAQRVRRALLARRGLIEMLVQRAISAKELICHGRYQASLACAPANAGSLISDNSSTLQQVCDALEQEFAGLSTDIESFDELSLVLSASKEGTALLASEIEDHLSRIKTLRTLVVGWRADLSS